MKIKIIENGIMLLSYQGERSPVIGEKITTKFADKSYRVVDVDHRLGEMVMPPSSCVLLAVIVTVKACDA